MMQAVLRWWREARRNNMLLWRASRDYVMAQARFEQMRDERNHWLQRAIDAEHENALLRANGKKLYHIVQEQDEAMRVAANALKDLTGVDT